MKRLLVVPFLLLGLLAAGLFLRAQAAETAEPEHPSTPRLTADLARREVRLLDDLYKTTIVYMNETYVVDENSVAAGEAARDLFGSLKKKGWHEARLVDATGKPINDANKPANDFEKQAIQRILKGETYVDQVVQEDGKKYLRAATLVPVINAKCVLCHPGNKIGGTLGAISYKIPIK